MWVPDQTAYLPGQLDSVQVKTYTMLRRPAVPAFRMAVCRAIGGYDKDEPETRRRKAHALLDLPKLHLRVFLSGNRRAKEKFLLEQLAGKVLAQPAPPSRPQDADERAVRRASFLLKEGYSGRAARALGQSDIAFTGTPLQRQSKLEALHPKESPLAPRYISDLRALRRDDIIITPVDAMFFFFL